MSGNATCALTASHILIEGRWETDRTILLEKNRIEVVCQIEELPAGIEQKDLGDGYLAPGYVDLQVNGGGGVLLNDEPTVAGLQTVAEAHRQFGTTSFLPTLITDGYDVMQRMADAIREARSRSLPGIIGVHFEGPYLNRDRKGVHDETRIRRFEEKFLDLLKDGDLGAVLITLAPEKVSGDYIRALCEAGAIVSAGHTTASLEQTRAAMQAGLTGFTHLYNAMPPMLSRDPGVVGAALSEPEGYCGIIADGFHVDPAVLKATIAAKTTDRIMLVTDAMPVVGSEQDSFTLYGNRITTKNGRCTTADGTLAGSALSMEQAVLNSLRMLDQPLEKAIKMASETPARFLELENDIGRIAPGCRADFVFLAKDGRLQDVITTR